MDARDLVAECAEARLRDVLTTGPQIERAQPSLRDARAGRMREPFRPDRVIRIRDMKIRIHVRTTRREHEPNRHKNRLNRDRTT